MASTGGTKALKTLEMMLAPPRGANTTGSLAEAMSGDWLGKGQVPVQSMDPSNWVSAAEAADALKTAKTGTHLSGLEAMLMSLLGQYEENKATGERRPALPQALTSLPQMPEVIGEAARRSFTDGYTPSVLDPATGRMYDPQQYEDLNLLASLVMTGGMPIAAPANSLRMFAGVTAKTADKAALELAKDMTKKGVPREEIWKATGWYKAPDGHWKFEIDDSRAVFRDYAMPKMDPFRRDKAIYDYLTAKGYKLERDPISGGIRNTPENHSAVPDNVMSEAWDYAKNKEYPVPETQLRNVLDHPELFKAYPDMAAMPTSPETSGLVYGSFDGQKMTVGGGTISKNPPISTVLHEGQHYVEEVEDFGRGGNTEFVLNHPDPRVQSVYNQRFENRFAFPSFDDWQQTYASRLAGQPEDEILRLYQLQKDFKESQKYDPYDQANIDARRDAAAATYRDLAGEVEARNTQARRGMTAKQRRETPPWETMDVPERANIVTFETPYGRSNSELPVEPPVQAISSAKTSLRQVPALLKSKVFEAAPGSRNLDLGGGAYDMGTEYLANERGVKSFVLDPFNRPDEHNKAVADMFKKDPADTVTVANVLNVIKEPGARLGVIKQAYENVKPGGKVYFDIYEGNRSSEGAATIKGFQNNAPAQFYLDEIKKVFPDVTRKGTILIATKPKATR